MKSKIVSKSVLNELKVIYTDVSLLKPALYNPRKHSAEKMVQLKESISKYGFAEPIVCNSASKRKNIVIGGHMRIKVAKELGMKELPVVYLNIPDIEKEKELNIRLNKNTGEWDYELLKSFDTTLLLDIGFESSDLSNAWDEMLETQNDDFDVEKELAKIKKPTTKIGDCFSLGNHRLICGSSIDQEVIKKLVGVDRVDMIYSDPPYNIGYNYDRGLGGKNKYGGQTKDNKSLEGYRLFLKQAIKNGLNVSKPNTHLFYYCDQNYVGILQELYRELGVENKRTVLWIKNNQNVVPQIAFNKIYEPCVYGTRGKPYLSPAHFNYNEVMNKEVTTGNQLIEDILELIDIWLIKRLPGQSYNHPTEKPPVLHEKALRRCTKVSDIILDSFAGSGSIMVACEQLKRRAFMVEVEPIFCDLIIHRYESLTGQKAKKLN